MNTKMSSKKKDLEIIFNLQWKYGPKVAERSNIVGVYDIPSTTLNWEPFKSYILKNSGTPGDDVKVSYLEYGRELPIESTLDFQKALYYFRKKAMSGEIINLKLESLSNGNKSSRFSPTCDAQTECSYDYKMEKAPEWFVSYMAEFKKDILDEVASAITTHVAVLKPSFPHSHYPRKSKTECAKRCRKNHHDGNEKEVLKTMKLEKKLESKMEKLVNKSKKLEKKKMSLITKSSDSDAGHSSSKSNSEAVSTVDVSKMNAAPIRCEENIIPHLMGGEVYRHCWKVINNGLTPWTEDTEVHFSWGSSLLEPIQRTLPCPLLNPGDIGIIEALVHVPKICGKYQMYWHFHHKGRKFGHWLGCEIIVLNSVEQLSTSFLRGLTSRYDIPASTSKIHSDFRTPYGSSVDDKGISMMKVKMENDEENSILKVEEQIKDMKISGKIPIPLRELAGDKLKPEIEEVVINKSPSKIQIIENYMNDIDESGKTMWKFNNINNSTELIQNANGSDHNIDVEEGGDSHSESISKIDEDRSSNSTLNDMVMVNFPDELEEEEVVEFIHDGNSGNHYIQAEGDRDYHSESISKVDENKLSSSTLNDMVMVNSPYGIEDQEVLGYAYVLIDGVKTPVPKKYLRADFLETAEEAPEPKKDDSFISYAATMEKFFGMKCDGTDNCEYKKNIPDDNDDYDDIPDLVPSHHVEDIPSKKTSLPENELEMSTRHFVFPEHHAGYEVINEKTFDDSDSDEEHQNIKNDEKQNPSTSNTSMFANPFHPQYQTFYDEEKKVLNPTSKEYSGNVDIYPTIDSNDLLTHIPNYQQTPPDLRPKSKPVTPQYTTEQSRITYTSKPGVISINAFRNDASCESRDEKAPSPGNSTGFAESDRLRSVPEASAPIQSVVSEAMTMASSALKTVVNKIIPSKNEPELGIWVNGHWVPTVENSIRENNLKILADMGFKNRDLNATLLARYDDDIRRVVAELVQ